MKTSEVRHIDRKAIAPLWEVKTAKLQTNIGDSNAGLTEEERAAKAGLLGFDWDGKGFLKPTDWIDKEDGFLMLDRDANGYVTTGNDLLSNPLIADPGKGLRILVMQASHGCCEIHSKQHNEYDGWVAIWCLKSLQSAVNDSNWRGVA